MWRLNPLLKIILRMGVFGLILGLALGLFIIVAFESKFPGPISYYYQQIMLGEVANGVVLGGLIGLAMAVYTGIVHRTIQKPHLFKFALLIVATIVSFAVVQQPFHIVTFIELGISPDTWFWALSDSVLASLFFAIIAKHVAIGLMSLYAAGRYLREASAQTMKSTGQEPA